ncbi:MAG: chromosomal replication initiator protein DnaA [Gammaproteobacteria bacterium]
MSAALWNSCLKILQSELAPETFSTWISPLQVDEKDNRINLLAPNHHVVAWLRENTLPRIRAIMDDLAEREQMNPVPVVSLGVGSLDALTHEDKPARPTMAPADTPPKLPANARGNRVNEKFTFDNFVEGKSNEFARAAAMGAAENPGVTYNPLFIYGGVGLGKTHLMQAVGNKIREKRKGARILYINSERFVGDMVRALQHNSINEFKQIYRTPDALLIDDIQFFAGKERSQEEFFHTFNALFEADQQIVLTSDRHPKELDRVEERLRSRFSLGITASIDPPELETSVAILKRKAIAMGVALQDDVAFFTAKLIRSNVRELEGGLRRLIAGSQFTGQPISVDFAKETFKDLLALRNRSVTIDNIKKTVAEYFSIRVSDLLSPKRTRSITRPRQIAMSIAKELTQHSLPEIGSAFGGRDHTTVLHACRKVKELRENDTRVEEDYTNLLRTLDQ